MGHWPDTDWSLVRHATTIPARQVFHPCCAHNLNLNLDRLFLSLSLQLSLPLFLSLVSLALSLALSHAPRIKLLSTNCVAFIRLTGAV